MELTKEEIEILVNILGQVQVPVTTAPTIITIIEKLKKIKIK